MKDNYLSDYRAYLYVERGYTHATVRTYTGILSRWFTYLQATKETDLHAALTNYLRSQSQLSYRVVSNMISVVKNYYLFLVREGITNEMPLKGFEKRKAHPYEHLPRTLSIQQATDVIESVRPKTWRADPTGYRDRAILELFYSSGLRVQELCDIQIGDLRRSEVLLLVHGKGQKERLVPMTETALKWVMRYLEHRKELHTKAQGYVSPSNHYLFVSNTGRKMCPQAVYNIVREAGQKAGIVGVHPHTMRHSIATHLLDNGAGIFEIKDLLGHESLATTAIYTHVSVQHLMTGYLRAHPRANVQPKVTV